jgi:HK97 gp10 family phage protein
MPQTSIRLVITRVVAPDELLAQIEPKMRNLGNAIGRRMQRIVPKRTWALHDSIRTETKRNDARVTTTITVGGGKVDYALHVERGTSRMAAQPFMRPALLQSRAADFLNGAPLGPRHGVTGLQRRRDAAEGRDGMTDPGASS